MPKFSALPELTTPAPTDELSIVDKSDTSEAATGTSKRIQFANLVPDGSITTAKLDDDAVAALSRSDGGTLTIAAGAITVGAAGRYGVVPEAAAADDILATINGGADGQVIVLSPLATKTIVFDNGAGNIRLERSRDLVLSYQYDSIILQKRSGTWVELGHTNGEVYRTITSNATLALSDAALVRGILGNSASAFELEVPNSSVVAIPSDSLIPVTNSGAGVLTIQGASGVTINGVSAGSVSVAQHASCKLWKTATNTWIAAQSGGSVADGSITTAKLAADAVDGSRIADDAVDSEHIAAGAIDAEHLSAAARALTALNSSDGGTLTIASGAITIGTAGHYIVTPEAAADDDILATITGGTEGQTIVLYVASTKTIIFDHNADNIACDGARDLVVYSLSGVSLGSAVLQKRGTYWRVLASAQPAGYRVFSSSDDLDLRDFARPRGVIASSASALTLSASVATVSVMPIDSIVPVTNFGAGPLTIEVETGVTINGSDAGSVDLAQYKSCILWKLAAGTLLAIGGIS